MHSRWQQPPVVGSQWTYGVRSVTCGHTVDPDRHILSPGPNKLSHDTCWGCTHFVCRQASSVRRTRYTQRTAGAAQGCEVVRLVSEELILQDALGSRRQMDGKSSAACRPGQQGRIRRVFERKPSPGSSLLHHRPRTRPLGEGSKRACATK